MNRLMLASALALGLIGCGGGSSSAETAHETTSSGSEMHHEQASSTEASATVVPPGQATIGDTTTCPVSGETFVVTETSPHVEHNGATYYFCCPGCDARFQANPEQYLTPAPAPAS